ncbi:YihY/virulence factor BrkB family protein [Ktedonospora formicarum]|uniref:YihY/virulence factor BrkB family protein n=1 Tax=Ktedonospora formicarum TaxID=2778364 RepID=A0A8J3IDH9_9CHLR|nr:YihY/virulence factor BrkB family protein [Ktedonospora formicarum]GHO50059.1 YihY/virulence factor BrkB family protein [Ktedonospora formicarum]
MASGTRGAGYTRAKDQHSTRRFIRRASKETKTLREFLNKFNNDWSSGLAGLLAYNILMSMVPIAIALIAILGFLLGGITDTKQLIERATAFFPTVAQNQDAVQLAITQLQKNAGWLTIIAVALALFSGSNLFINMEGCLNIVYRVRTRPFVRQRLIAITMVLIFILLVPIMVLISSLPTFALGLLATNPALQKIPFISTIATNPIISYMASFLGSVLVGFILFEAIFIIVPNQRISLSNSWLGALSSALGLALFLLLFPLYARFGLSSYTGQVGFAVILLIFFYYFALILMIGAEINAFFSEGVHPIPNNLVTFISTMAHALNEDRPASEGHAHIDSQPTERADEQHIEKVRLEEADNQRRNLEKAQQTPGQKRRHKLQLEKPQSPKRMMLLEVAVGSALAVLLEWLHLRRKL